MKSPSLPEIPYDNNAIAIAVSTPNLGTVLPVPITLETMQTACADYFGKESQQQSTSFSNVSSVPSIDNIAALETRYSRRSFQAGRTKEPRLQFEAALTQFISKITKFPTLEFLRSTIDIPVLISIPAWCTTISGVHGFPLSKTSRYTYFFLPWSLPLSRWTQARHLAQNPITIHLNQSTCARALSTWKLWCAIVGRIPLVTASDPLL